MKVAREEASVHLEGDATAGVALEALPLFIGGAVVHRPYFFAVFNRHWLTLANGPSMKMPRSRCRPITRRCDRLASVQSRQATKIGDKEMFMIKAVVFDFDDVIRKWNSEETFAIEERYGLPRGCIFEKLSDPTLIQRVTTGVISDEQWRDGVAEQLVALHGDEARQAVQEWSVRIGDLDTDVVDLLRTLRSRFTIALLSNATSRLRSDLAAHGIVDDFDYIFSSAEIGIGKPDAEVFAIVGRTLDLAPEEWLFIDDIAGNVAAANELGVRSHLFTNLPDLVRWLTELTGVDLSRS
jgi:putative hydrolase of the HAD superfamily